VSLEQYFERILKEEREATRLAEEEREKTAVNVRLALEQSMESGGARLQDHIDNQVTQVRAALTALNQVLHERDLRQEDKWEFSQKAIDKAEASLKDALDKAEESLNKRLVGMNDFQKQITLERTSYVLRETYDASLESWVAWRGGVDKFQYRLMGAFALAMIIMPIIVGVMVYFLTRTAIPIDGLAK